MSKPKSPWQPIEPIQMKKMSDEDIAAGRAILSRMPSPAEPQVEHNNYCDKAGSYPRSHPCVRCQSDYLKRKQQEGK